jgi:outer membrane protein, multidrug efflux system
MEWRKERGPTMSILRYVYVACDLLAIGAGTIVLFGLLTGELLDKWAALFLKYSLVASLPWQLLERRPDIQPAEAQLIAANADVGVAKAQLFPEFSLSGEGGVATSQLKGLVDSKNMYWLASGNVAQTIFDGGRLRNNLKLSKAEKEEEVLVYQQTIQKAFQNVSDALIGLQKFREYRDRKQN